MFPVPEKMFTMYDLTPEDTATYIDFDKKPDEENWWHFKSLTYLDLSSNVLQEIPGKIGMFEDLTVLNVIIRLTKLNTINFTSSCKITTY